MIRLIDKKPVFIIKDDASINDFIEWFFHINGIEDSNKKLTQIEKNQPYNQVSKGILETLTRDILAHCKSIRISSSTIFERGISVYCSTLYDDYYYRDIYSLYYSKKYYQIENNCRRIFLFDYAKEKQSVYKEIKAIENDKEHNIKDEYFTASDAFIGAIVNRPIQGCEIGRTLINPAYIRGQSDNNNTLKCNIWCNEYKMTMFGIPLKVWAFPYSMQDGEVSTCAETTILNMMDYYSYRYCDYKRILPSDITKTARKNSNQRNLPSQGLTYEIVSKIFMEFGFSPILYTSQTYKHRFADILHSYVASGIPVALGIKEKTNPSSGHSVILIGTEQRLIDSNITTRKKAFKTIRKIRIPQKNEDTTHYIAIKNAIENSYIVMDDGREPYSIATIKEDHGKVFLQYKKDENTKWEVTIFTVPMGSEMSMDAANAFETFRTLLTREDYSYSNYIKSLNIYDPTEEVMKYLKAGQDIDFPLLTRIFLCPSKRLKEQRIKTYLRNRDFELLSAFQDVHLPRFVWVCELYTKASYTDNTPKCIGEIILDATTGTSPYDEASQLIWLRYPFLYVFRKPGEGFIKITQGIMNKIDKKEIKLNRVDPFIFNRH